MLMARDGKRPNRVRLRLPWRELRDDADEWRVRRQAEFAARCGWVDTRGIEMIEIDRIVDHFEAAAVVRLAPEAGGGVAGVRKHHDR